MTKRDYHVVFKAGEWAVKKEGAVRASSLHATKEDALQAGIRLAKQQRSELVIHRKDGTIQDSDSYGKDHCPPKDKKH